MQNYSKSNTSVSDILRRSLIWLVTVGLLTSCAQVHVSSPIVVPPTDQELKKELRKNFIDTSKALNSIKLNGLRTRTRESALDLALAVSTPNAPTTATLQGLGGTDNPASSRIHSIQDVATALTIDAIHGQFSDKVNDGTYDQLQDSLMLQESIQNAVVALDGFDVEADSGRRVYTLRFILNPDPNWWVRDGHQAQIKLNFFTNESSCGKGNPPDVQILDVSPKTYSRRNLETASEGEFQALDAMLSAITPEGVRGEGRGAYAQLQTEQNAFVQRYPELSGGIRGRNTAVFTINPTFRVAEMPWLIRWLRRFRITSTISTEGRPVSVKISVPESTTDIYARPYVSWESLAAPFVPVDFPLLPNSIPFMAQLNDLTVTVANMCKADKDPNYSVEIEKRDPSFASYIQVLNSLAVAPHSKSSGMHNILADQPNVALTTGEFLNSVPVNSQLGTLKAESVVLSSKTVITGLKIDPTEFKSDLLSTAQAAFKDLNEAVTGINSTSLDAKCTSGSLQKASESVNASLDKFVKVRSASPQIELDATELDKQGRVPDRTVKALAAAAIASRELLCDPFLSHLSKLANDLKAGATKPATADCADLKAQLYAINRRIAQEDFVQLGLNLAHADSTLISAHRRLLVALGEAPFVMEGIRHTTYAESMKDEPKPPSSQVETDIVFWGKAQPKKSEAAVGAPEKITRRSLDNPDATMDSRQVASGSVIVLGADKPGFKGLISAEFGGQPALILGKGKEDKTVSILLPMLPVGLQSGQEIALRLKFADNKEAALNFIAEKDATKIVTKIDKKK